MSYDNLEFEAKTATEQWLLEQLAEANKMIAEAQAHIKVLEDALVNAVIPLRGIDMRNHSELAKTEVLNAIGKIDAALFTTCPTEALDKVVREAVEKERERCAKVCMDYAKKLHADCSDWVNTPKETALHLQSLGAKYCAEAIRRIEP